MITKGRYASDMVYRGLIYNDVRGVLKGRVSAQICKSVVIKPDQAPVAIEIADEPRDT